MDTATFEKSVSIYLSTYTYHRTDKKKLSAHSLPSIVKFVLGNRFICFLIAVDHEGNMVI